MAKTKTKELSPLEQLQADVLRYRSNTMQSLRRDARNQRDRLRQEAVNALEQAEREASVPEDSRLALAHAILATVHDIVQPVIASLNLDPRLTMRVAAAWTQHW